MDKLILGPFKDAAGHGPVAFFLFCKRHSLHLPANYRCALFDSIKIYLIIVRQILMHFSP
ncbi:MAG TPA: hypothetical protein DHU26_05390 [Spirochaetaceae bacterium]|nr:hypothetical protein [Spirochaetaceae bacterium]HCX96401.1 hypothetical protein [Spirochaetaceae bacterium]